MGLKLRKTEAGPTTAYYLRVSTVTQRHDSQKPELLAFAKAQADEDAWYEDTFSGRTMDRPGFRAMMGDVRRGQIKRVVVWRLDRLGRTAAGLTQLFAELVALGVELVSLRDGFSLTSPAGRMLANVLASVAQFETEVRSERVAAGQAAARAAGKKWGGSEPGRQLHVCDEQIETLRRMKAEGASVAAMARATRLTRPTVYRYLGKIV